MMIRVAVVGSRAFDDLSYLECRMNDFIEGRFDPDLDKLCLVSGGAMGADSLAEEWADCTRYDIVSEIHKPDYNVHGTKAPLIRNEHIARTCDILVAFWDGKSRGTKHTIGHALNYGNEIHVYRYDLPDDIR